jgi:uncharacterized protein YodC (DUF2158 family)
MMTGGLKAGDVVTLKTGGPEMVVEVVDNNGAACSWFVAGGVLQRHTFYPGNLVVKSSGIGEVMQ